MEEAKEDLSIHQELQRAPDEEPLEEEEIQNELVEGAPASP